MSCVLRGSCCLSSYFSTIYDANNQRVTKTTPSGTIHYVYGLDGLLYGEYDATGNLIREYVYLNGEPLAQIDNISSSDVITYLHTDHLGTPRTGSNASGVNVWAWDSDAFGNGTPSGTVTVNLRFAGQYFDSESNLHYNWNRYYDPETGRYISSDPIGLAGGLNTFAYVGANPVMYIDLEGLEAEHTKNKRPSTKNKHEQAEERRKRDKGGEKGDKRRPHSKRGNPDKEKSRDNGSNKKKKGKPWKHEPKIPSLPPFYPPVCVMFPDYCGNPNVAFRMPNTLDCDK